MGFPAIAFIPLFSSEVILVLGLLMIPVLLLYLYIIISEEAFELAGMPALSAILMTIGALIGSFIDIPFYAIENVTLAVNAGGCLIPLIISVELIARRRVRPGPMILAVLFVAAVSYYFSTPTPGQGILMPFYIAPLAGAFAGILMTGADITAPGTAYAAGAMGTLLGADIFHLVTPGTIGHIAAGSASVLSIGGAGVFDGIFLTGIFAVFLAALIARRIRGEGKGAEPGRQPDASQ
ncbi:DUF1614 domain-containing protein [Methanofollis fontis]|nr:DUF1614 domain-containing protein [Methanofollis fontis]